MQRFSALEVWGLGSLKKGHRVSWILFRVGRGGGPVAGTGSRGSGFFDAFWPFLEGRGT